MNQENNSSRDEFLSVEEEVALIKQIQQSPDDCEEAKSKLLRANRRFVVACAKRQMKRHPSHHTLDELINEGNQGVLFAAKKFDETQGYKFISYAVWFIRTSMENYIHQG